MRIPQLLLGAAIGVQLAGVAFGACHPTTEPDKSDIGNARAAIEAQCGCATAASHAAYVRCAAQQASAVLVNASCAGAVRKCASKSTCGRPGFATCCRTNRSGRTSCAIKSSASRCTPPGGGSACVGNVPSCCDACGAGGCAATTTSTSTTSTTLTGFCGDNVVNEPNEFCDGTDLGFCAGQGFECGDPGLPTVACRCCLPAGGVFFCPAPPDQCQQLACCDGSPMDLIGPATYVCPPYCIPTGGVCGVGPTLGYPCCNGTCQGNTCP